MRDPVDCQQTCGRAWTAERVIGRGKCVHAFPIDTAGLGGLKAVGSCQGYDWPKGSIFRKNKAFFFFFKALLCAIVDPLCFALKNKALFFCQALKEIRP